MKVFTKGPRKNDKAKVTFFFRWAQTFCKDCALTISDIDKRFFAFNRRKNGENSLRATFFDFDLWGEISAIFVKIRQNLNLAPKF